MKVTEIKGIDGNAITLDLAETMAAGGVYIECEDGVPVRLVED